MKTLFALHCITKRNIDDKFYDKTLQALGYDEKNVHASQMPSAKDYAQGQIDEHLIEKGRFQAKLIAIQVKGADFKVKRIYCADQHRCKETAQIIAENIGYPCEIIVDARLNARSYGLIAEKAMDTDKLKHFWKHKDVLSDLESMKLIAFYLAKPEKIGAEPKDVFKARINEFLQDKNVDLNDALVVAGSDAWKIFKDYPSKYEGQKDSAHVVANLYILIFQKKLLKNLRKQKEKYKSSPKNLTFWDFFISKYQKVIDKSFLVCYKYFVNQKRLTCGGEGNET